MSANADHVRRLLGHGDLRWLVDRTRRRLEHGLRLEGAVVLSRATPAQRRAVEGLLGRAVRSGTALSVPLEALERTLLRAGAASDLRSAIEALDGPVIDRSEAQSALNRAWADAFAPLVQAARRKPALAPWLEMVHATGLLRRTARGDAALALRQAQQAARLLDRLPARATPLSVLASSVADDGHALDAGRPLAALVIRAAAILGDIPDGQGAEWRRTVWASVGVLSGELTSPVLCLNLPGDSSSATGRALGVWSEVGQPLHLSARQLLRDSPAMRDLHERCVYVCENPTVVAEAANALGPRSAPLVCCSGHPAGAAVLLLRLLVAAGARLRYHGDFDWPGITIANGIVARFGAEPWRLDAAAYRAAADRGGAALRGRAVQAAWDPDLSRAMQSMGIKVEEERVLADLLADLAR